MKQFALAALAAALSGALSGCAATGVADPAPIKVTADTFCEVKRGLHGPAGKQEWSTRDTPDTIRNIARENAAVDRRCRQKPAS